MGAKNLIGMKQEEVQVEECDVGNMVKNWDRTIKDVARLERLLTPVVKALPKPKSMVQPYVLSNPLHNESNVVSQEEPIRKLLEKLKVRFKDELLDIIVVDKEEDCDPTKDIEELERLLVKDHQSSSMEIKVTFDRNHPQWFLKEDVIHGLG
ncbi:hypothetical protein Tco_1386435 [Tanacetum coccineum]